MRILVTGHKGFIGGNMYRSLQDQGHEVSGYEYGDSLPIISKYDWVMHMGAISSTTERDVDKVMRQNYDSSVALYDEARASGVNFQFSSSASVYGLGNTFREDAPADPRNPYAWSKYMFERYLLNHSSPRSQVQIFRYFNVYGPEGEEHKGDQASPHAKFKCQAKLTGCIKVFEGSEKYLRDFIHVSEVIQIQQKFLHTPAIGVYNIGTGKTQSFLDIAKMYSSKIIEIPMPEVLKSNYQAYTCADMTKTNQISK
jgi:ADP-L-glycero-D-manno-heptose 6-epimerase